MPAPSSRSVVRSDAVEVETPELVVLSYTTAGVGSRAYAAIIDFLICVAGVLAVVLASATFLSSAGLRFGGRSAAWVLAVLGFVQFAVQWGYYVLCEALFDGQTLGKRSQRLRVVSDGGYSVTFGASAVRNLVRLVDQQPVFLYAIGTVSALVSRTGKRLGDMAAGTLVVREEIVNAPSGVAAAERSSADSVTEPIPSLQGALTEAEFVVLERFHHRQADLDVARRTALAEQLAARFAAPLASYEDAPALPRLERLFQSERLSRRRGFAARNERGAGRERHAIIAAGSARWARFASRLAAAQKRGLSKLGEDGVREFVREYRELTADLARLRTASQGREADEVFYLNRLASGAHNLLYRRRSISLGDIAGYVFVEVPREIRASVAPILLAAVLLFGPAAITYSAVLGNPALAERLLPVEMLDRAENGVQRAQEGTGYIPDPQVFRPVMASGIITNNVQVAFAAFAFGITAGVLTAWVLLSNGISLGAVFGLYGSKGIGSLLLAFVAPHGPLEFAAIFIAGGAGFLLAAALLVPGDRTRRRALIENGRRAIKLVTGAGLLLVVAGALEGFVSPIPWWPLAGKLAVSGLTIVALYVYLRLGAGSPGRLPVARALDSSP